MDEDDAITKVLSEGTNLSLGIVFHSLLAQMPPIGYSVRFAPSN
ncbi:MAG: hypothetical protein PHF67_04690 [Candidatus Nanoarchaeia archaeon]|nr:hypothetical protein [Candidatus Nanoarchaeia archaeon]